MITMGQKIRIIVITSFFKSIYQFIQHCLPTQTLQQHCFLCHAYSDKVICPKCQQDLPHRHSVKHCGQCGIPLLKEGYCIRCIKMQPAFHHTYYCLYYHYPLKPIIHATKYYNDLVMLSYLGKFMCESIHADLPDVFVPVPLHPRRLKERGYNQSLILANILGRYHQVPVDIHISQRIKYTESQARLSPDNRYKNVQNAFKVKTPLPKAWQHIVLVDDVMTTGNTANALAKEFKKAGARQVDVWVLARAGEISNTPELTIDEYDEIEERKQQQDTVLT